MQTIAGNGPSPFLGCAILSCKCWISELLYSTPTSKVTSSGTGGGFWANACEPTRERKRALIVLITSLFCNGGLLVQCWRLRQSSLKRSAAAGQCSLQSRFHNAKEFFVLVGGDGCLIHRFRGRFKRVLCAGKCQGGDR